MTQITTTPDGNPARAEGKRDLLIFAPDSESMDSGFIVYHRDRFGRGQARPVGWFSPLPAGGWHTSVTVRGYDFIREDTYAEDLISDLLAEVEARYESEEMNRIIGRLGA